MIIVVYHRHYLDLFITLVFFVELENSLENKQEEVPVFNYNELTLSVGMVSLRWTLSKKCSHTLLHVESSIYEDHSK